MRGSRGRRHGLVGGTKIEQKQVIPSEAAVREMPILSYDEAQQVGVRVHDHWMRMTGEAPIPRDNLGWADLVQFVTRVACERVADRGSEDDIR